MSSPSRRDPLAALLGTDEGEKTRPKSGPLLRLLLLMVLPAVVMRFGGFRLSENLLWGCRAAVWGATGALFLQWLSSLRRWESPAHFLRTRPGGAFFVLIGVVVIPWAGSHYGLAGLTAAAGAWSFAVASHRAFRAVVLSPTLQHAPMVTLVGSFAVIIVGGALLLWLVPRSLAEGKSITFLDALFTATSATCVTGLETVATGTTFSPFGQAVVLTLIQLGGLGIMTLGTFLVLSTGSRLGLGGRAMLGEALNLEDLGRVSRLVAAIFALTFVIEGVGALCFLPWFAGDENPLFSAVFHSVSAFCNAGIGLRSSSFQEFSGAVSFNVVAMTLIFFGGLGFTVLMELLRWAGGGFRQHRKAHWLSLHSRLVLTASAVLIVMGALAFGALEWHGCLEGRSMGERTLVSVFQSVSARTAGFSTVDFSAPDGQGVGHSSRFFLLFLMLVGASPGSTGGGMKTTTLVVLLLAVTALFGGRRHVEVGGRRIPDDIMKKAAAIVFCYAITLFLGVLALLVTEGDTFAVGDLLFETVSAIGTVGYSVGVSGSEALSQGGKVVLTILMFAGRLGPLTLVLFTAGGRGEPPPVEFPEERVMIG